MAQMGRIDPSRLHGLLGSLQCCARKSITGPPLEVHAHRFEDGSI